MTYPTARVAEPRADDQARTPRGAACPATAPRPRRRSGLRQVALEEVGRLQVQRGGDLRDHPNGRVADTSLEFGKILLRHARGGLQLLLRQLAFMTPNPQVAPQYRTYVLHPTMFEPGAG